VSKAKETIRNTWVLLFSLGLAGCSSLLYHPTFEEHFPTSKFNLKPDDVWIPVGDTDRIHGRYFHAKDTQSPKGVLVFFHGNGENLSSHYLSLVWVLSHGYDYFIFDYRGYGQSPGDPTPEGTVEDGKAAVEWVYGKNPNLPLIIFGQSLGGAIAMRTVIDLKSQRVPIRLVVIDSGFASYKAAARNVLAQHWLTWIFQPFTYLALSDSAAPGERVSEISPVPMLFMHGDRDKVIDISLGEKAYEMARPPKEFWKIPGGEHTDALWRKEPDTRKRFLNYLDRMFAKGSTSKF
jgi:pimeloyl-ACP methyl ester carboxylesterase